jgi:hypothetical protein
LFAVPTSIRSINIAFAQWTRTPKINRGKNTPGGNPPLAGAIVRRLIDTRGSELTPGESAALATASACDHAYKELSRWVGADGCHALFSRALALAVLEHSALSPIRLRARSHPYVDGVSAAIAAEGDAPTAAALESMLIRLVELLGRLIGDDMAANLIERGLHAPGRGDSTRNRTREQA